MKKLTVVISILLTFSTISLFTACSGQTDNTNSAPAASSSNVVSEEVSSIPEPAPTLVDFKFDEPEKFKPDSENPMLLTVKDGSYIEVSIFDGNIEDWTKEHYLQSLKDEYEAKYNKKTEKADVGFAKFETVEIDGLPAISSEYYVSMYKNKVLHYVIERLIQADGQLYRVRYSDVNKLKGVWTDDFRKSAKTIDFIWSNE